MSVRTPVPVLRPIPFMYHFGVTLTSLLFLPGVRVEGAQNVPATGPVIIAGSHASGLDPLVLAQVVPRGRFIQYMAKKELFKNPVLAWLLRSFGTFPVNREGNDVGAIRSALRILQAGGTLGIFPQGTRGGTEIQPGTALIALRAKSPVVPTLIRREGRRWTVRYGPPITSEGGVEELTAKIGAAIGVLRGQG